MGSSCSCPEPLAFVVLALAFWLALPPAGPDDASMFIGIHVFHNQTLEATRGLRGGCEELLANTSNFEPEQLVHAMGQVQLVLL